MKNFLSIAALCAITAIVLSFGATPSGATVTCDRYAATSGSDSAAGTAAQPYRTAQKLADSLSAGQTGCLVAGVFNESLRLNNGGSPGNPIRLTSAPGGRATLVGRLYVPDTANDAVFADLNLDGTNASNLPSPMVAGDRITFTGNDVTDNHTSICFGLGSAGWGTAVDVVIDGNRIHDCGRLPATNHDHGIYVEATRNAVITNNYIYDNADRGIQLYPDAQGTRIANNVIDGNGEGILFSGESGLASSNNLVTRNIVSNANVRYNVESWWPVGNPIGTGNVASDNCIWNGAQGNVAAQVGFTAVGSKAVNPLYIDRAAKDFELQSGSPCAGYGPAGTATPTPPVIPTPPVTPTRAAASAPANRKAPTISGTARVGQQLGATSGAWSGTAPMIFAYAWQRCDLNGANCATTGRTGAAYSLSTADLGHMMRLVVQAQNSMGQASATSTQSAVVQVKKSRRGWQAFTRNRTTSRLALLRLVRPFHR